MRSVPSVAPTHILHSVPVPEGLRNGDRVIAELSRGNELPNVFLKLSRWLKPLHKNILQAGQHFCYSGTDELLQGDRVRVLALFETWPSRVHT
jgi:hypothetical protein